MKCQNCQFGRITEALKGKFPNEKPENIPLRYCSLDLEFHKSYFTCEKFSQKVY